MWPLNTYLVGCDFLPQKEMPCVFAENFGAFFAHWDGSRAFWTRFSNKKPFE